MSGDFQSRCLFYAGVIGAADLFQIKEYQRLVYPLGISVLLLSIAIASNFAEHIKEGLQIVTIYMHIPLQIVIPFLLLLVAVLRQQKQIKKIRDDRSPLFKNQNDPDRDRCGGFRLARQSHPFLLLLK